jgi:soluble lytic murein transglycosylase-like protein
MPLMRRTLFSIVLVLLATCSNFAFNPANALALVTEESAPIPSIDMQRIKSEMMPSAPPAATPTISPNNRAVSRLFPQIPPQDVGGLTQFIQRYNRKLSNPQAAMMAEAILGISQNAGIDYRLVTAVVAVESSFRVDVISSSGAIGLGQLKPATAAWLGVSNPFDPLDNLAGTTRYIRFLLDRYKGNMDAAIAAYFQGQGFVDRNGITDICKAYLTKVNTVLSQM